MAYATADNIVVLYGADVLDAVAARDNSGRQSPEAVTAALDAASAEIDTYLGTRYTVPLTTVPPYIRQICVDITVYRLALDVGPRTEEMRLRYQDAIEYLKSISAGSMDLPITDGGGGGGTGGQGAGSPGRPCAPSRTPAAAPAARPSRWRNCRRVRVIRPRRSAYGRGAGRNRRS